MRVWFVLMKAAKSYQEAKKAKTKLLVAKAKAKLKPKTMDIFLENSENFQIFTKGSKNIGEFLNFQGAPKIFGNFLVFSYAFFNFLDSYRMFIENS